MSSTQATSQHSVVTEEHIAIIARRHLNKWEDVCPYLGLKNAEENIRRTPGDYHDQNMAMLKIWKRQQGNKATYRVLIQAAENALDNMLADRIREMISAESAAVDVQRQHHFPSKMCVLPIAISLLVVLGVVIFTNVYNPFIKDMEERIPANIKIENQTASIAVMIIGSIISNQEVVSQSPADLSNSDSQILTKLGLPQGKWDNLNALRALYKYSTEYDVLSVRVSTPGMELDRSYILEQIELIFKTSKNIVVLHYYGSSQRNTGDWSFRDGFITFRDIADLYMKHSRGQKLGIISDCHSSGRWVSECAKFLDEQGVKPCGHSAMEKGILLRVVASCRTGQDSAELAYTLRGMKLKEELDGSHRDLFYYFSKEFSAQQKVLGVDFTKHRCGKGNEEKCNIASNATWSTAREVTDGRIKLVRRNENGRPMWQFILLDDDAQKIRDFYPMAYLPRYGTVLRSGEGKNPSPEDEEWMSNNYEPKINTERGQQDLPVQMVPFAAVIVIGAVLFWVIYK